MDEYLTRRSDEENVASAEKKEKRNGLEEDEKKREIKGGEWELSEIKGKYSCMI